MLGAGQLLHWPLLEKDLTVLIMWEYVWAPELILMLRRRGKTCCLQQELEHSSSITQPATKTEQQTDSTNYYYYFTTTHCSLKAYCAILVRCSNFCHQASPRVSPRDSTQRRNMELWARNVRQFCLNADFHVTFRDLLHAVKLRHGTDGFTSPPKEGMLWIFSP
jgi:hypothetical protein